MLSSRIKKFLILLLLVFSFIRVDAIVKPTNNYYINDYAGILREEMQKYILKRSIALDRASQIQVVVVTISSTEGMSIEEYANTLYNNFKIGKDNKGALILLCPQERLIRIEIGDGLGGILPDGKVGRILDDYVIPTLKKDDWNQGIKNAYDAIYQTIVEEYNLNLDYTIPTRPYPVENISITEKSGYYIYGFIFGVFIGVIINIIVFKNNKKLQTTILALYLIFVGIMYIIVNVYRISFLVYFFSLSNVFGYLITLNGSTGGTYYRGHGRYMSTGRSSSSYHIGGHGGHSSGGGATRKF